MNDRMQAAAERLRDQRELRLVALTDDPDFICVEGLETVGQAGDYSPVGTLRLNLQSVAYEGIEGQISVGRTYDPASDCAIEFERAGGENPALGYIDRFLAGLRDASRKKRLERRANRLRRKLAAAEAELEELAAAEAD